MITCKPNKSLPSPRLFWWVFYNSNKKEARKETVLKRGKLLCWTCLFWRRVGIWNSGLEKLLSDQGIRNWEDNNKRCEEDRSLACELPEESKDYQGCSHDICWRVTDTANPGQLGLNNQPLLRRDQHHRGENFQETFSWCQYPVAQRIPWLHLQLASELDNARMCPL